MFLSTNVIGAIVVIFALVVVMAWALGRDQGVAWEERAKRRRDNKKVRRWQLDNAEARIRELENDAAPSPIEKEDA